MLGENNNACLVRVCVFVCEGKQNFGLCLRMNNALKKYIRTHADRLFIYVFLFLSSLDNVMFLFLSQAIVVL